MKTEFAAPITVSQHAQVRADHYRVLARLLAEPPAPALLAVLQRIDPGDGVSTGLRSRWHDLKTAVLEADPSALRAEYQALFIGLGRGEVMPYACRYLTGLLMDTPLAGLRTALAQFGITRMPTVPEPEDHAAALCETMALLCSEEDSTAAVDEFFNRFVASWMIRFFQDLQQAPSAGFYRVVGTFGEAFIHNEIRHHARNRHLGPRAPNP